MTKIKFSTPSSRSMQLAISKDFDGILGYELDDDGQPTDCVGFFSKYISPNLGFCETSPLKKLDICYLAYLRINGFCTVDDKIGYIWVTFGVKIRFPYIFNAILGHSICYPEVGSLDNLPKLVDKNLADLTASLDISQIGSPLADRPRFIQSARLAFYAELFLIFHEVAHLRNGHVAYKFSNDTQFAMDEAGLYPSIDNAISQTLEWDADCTATSLMLNFILNAQPRIVGDQNLASVGDQLLERDINSNLRDFVFAVCIYFRIFHDNHYELRNGVVHENVSQLLAFSHPPAYVRIRSCVLLISEALNVTFGLDSRKYDDVIRNAVLEAEQGWHLATAAQFRSPFSEELSDAFGKFMNIYRDRWNTLRAQLEPHNFGGRLAP